ncbi:glutaredoxin [Nemania sp. FL0031]|nr:glutaredoxin [Nemania sp. FL0031]
MSAVKEITSEDEWQAHVAALPSSTLLIISFHAPWAAPCTQMSLVIKTLAAECPPDGKTSWVSINAEDLSDISETYDVIAVPYLVLQRNDQVLETVSGSSAIEVRTAIEKYTKGAKDAKNIKNIKNTGGASPAPTNGTVSTTGADHGSVETQGEAAEVETESDPAKAKEALFKRLGELVKAARVMVFIKGTPSAPQCGFSRQLVALLRERSVKYGFFNILADDDVRQGLKEFADWPTYPQVWMDGELVGGLDIIKEELENNPDFFKAYSAIEEVKAA